MKLLSGVELSFRGAGKHGLHILAVFREDSDADNVNSFLQALDRDPAEPLFTEQDHRDIDSKGNIADALKALRERFGCLLIVPHPGDQNGICKSLQPADAARLLRDISPDALEHCAPSDLRKLESTHILDDRFFEHLSIVEFSDPKSIEDIGAKHLTSGSPRATYLKLSALDLDAIRLALHDPETRLQIGEPPLPIHARIRRMKVAGSGFLGDLEVRWNDDLNVLIGGRGVGKSAVIETLRYALSMEPHSDQSYREGLVRHALGSGGRVEVELERFVGNAATRKYIVTRVFGEESRVTDSDSNKIVSIVPSELLGPGGGPTILGQREIFFISTSEEYRLALLDELIGEEARERADAVRTAIEQVRANTRRVLDDRATLAKRDEHAERLKTVEHELDVYEKHSASEKLGEVANLRSDGQQLRTAAGAVSRAVSEWTEVTERILVPIESSRRNLLRGQSQHRGILEEAAAAMGTLHARLQELAKQTQAVFGEADQSLRTLSARWADLLRPLEEEINRIKQEAQTESLDPDRLLRLTEERTALLPLIEELNRREAHLSELLRSRQTLLAQVRDRRHEENRLRRERAESIGSLLEGRLRLQVEFKGQKEDYKRRLSALLRGSGVSQDALDRLVAPEATDGIALAEAARAGAAEVQVKFNVTLAMAERLAKWLSADESRMFELETLVPADSLEVGLRVDQNYRSLDHLSVGQKATAILLLLFALEGRVLVFDQPEDDLDNRFVYEDIVQILRHQKGLKQIKKRRQVIAATHNANIPVLGDAELVLGLEAQEDHAQVVGRASIDDAAIRELVKTVMEGGEEAFLRRAEKYGGLTHRESR